MRIPILKGVIERRILANYRVDPDVLARLLPGPFRPLTVSGFGLAGVCLIRLGGVRPRGMPAWLGINSENAAQRAAVEWTDEAGRRRTGVYIWRRDTNHRLNAWAGGRLFPGEHHLARFNVDEHDDRWRLKMESRDRKTCVDIDGRLGETWPSDSVFATTAHASDFFAAGSLGYSATAGARRFDGLDSRCPQWQAESLGVESIRAKFFDDPERFPPGSIHFDSALAMQNIVHTWHGQPSLAAENCCVAAI